MVRNGSLLDSRPQIAFEKWPLMFCTAGGGAKIKVQSSVASAVLSVNAWAGIRPFYERLKNVHDLREKARVAHQL